MKIIGMNSGTSADGIDIGLCEISGSPPQIQARILRAKTYSYPDALRRQILDACLPSKSRGDALCQLNFDLGEAFAAKILQFIHEHELALSEIDLIGSHGQTVWHYALPDGSISSTLQLSEAAIITERAGITTISNFRARDIAAGGQGAPLTGYADWLLLRHPENWRAVQNIGGIGNVTFLPPLSDAESPPIAFDTGPGNVLIDAAITSLSGGRQTYDSDGAIAQSGAIDERWLEALLDHDYYKRLPPKTTGRELFGAEMAAHLVHQGKNRGLDDAGIIATLTALTVFSIAHAYRDFAPAPIAEVIIGGGGSNNPALMELLRQSLNLPVYAHEDFGIASDFKETLVFAILAHETWHGRPGNHPAITGARHPVILGDITPGSNYPDLVRRTWKTK